MRLSLVYPTWRGGSRSADPSCALVFFGTALPADALNDGTFDIMAWLGKHGQDVTRPILDKVIAGLKADGITTLGA